jgi:2,3-bisphosphoglycerate-independent phosphoglycerate mutase
MNKVMLVIRDGWGYSTKKTGNAILSANTPFDDWLETLPAKVTLSCHGESVGLPPGFQGSSEVGHLNMGAGRIVEQEVTRIFNAIKNKKFFDSPCFNEIRSLLNNSNTNLHFVGLLQDEGVHAHQKHLFELYRFFRADFPDTHIWIHPIADGRDTPPKSFLHFYNMLREKISPDPNTHIGTVWGRYYGMDRSKNWSLIKVATDAMIHGKGLRVDNFESGVRDAYDNEKTPDNVPMSDEYLKPLISKSYPGIRSEDVVINFNYRQDRAIQISQAFLDPQCPIFSPEYKRIHYYGLTRYYNEFKPYLLPPMDDSGSLKNILGDVLSHHKKRQLRLAETQKFRHVTSFFNGKNTHPFPLEDQIEIPSQWDPSSFASHPEMNAADVSRELLNYLPKHYDFILVNYANCDMVGHTGNFHAAQKAVECVDENVEKITRAALLAGYVVIITADHGNSEELLDEKGNIKTAHTINPVKLYIVTPPKEKTYNFNTSRGVLSDVAPLVLTLMHLPVPAEMTTRTLVNALSITRHS